MEGSLGEFIVLVGRQVATAWMGIGELIGNPGNKIVSR